ncbi:NFX1-type zinc finger-containing protein 1-like [Haliotis rufescens]|uniref:NFX1-type zinc finger-containing protein 1-like n=1 Tax=Haliotis rufescens TaxID=6454 RepID=UPI00201E771E|nr:NFX1-type zinc finger-containing protein 1-like [Haliotis rufescens]XP_048246579.1 NFX1-type zinc finger-containing protein 1-like [Haliotis rufescens]
MSKFDVDESVCEVSGASLIMVGTMNTINYSPRSVDVDCIDESPDTSTESEENSFLDENISSKVDDTKDKFQEDTKIDDVCPQRDTQKGHSPTESFEDGESSTGLEDENENEDEETSGELETTTSVVMFGNSNTLNINMADDIRSIDLGKDTKVTIKYRKTINPCNKDPPTESNNEKRQLRITIDVEDIPYAMDAAFANYHRPRANLKEKLGKLFDQLNYIIDLVTPGSIVIELRPTTGNSIEALLASIENGQFDNIVKELLSDESVFKLIAGKEVTVTVDLSIPEELIQKAGTSVKYPSPVLETSVLSDVTVTVREEGQDDDNSSQSSSVDPPDLQCVEEDLSTSVDPTPSADDQGGAAISVSSSRQKYGRPGKLTLSSLKLLQDSDPSNIIIFLNEDIRGFKTMLTGRDVTPRDIKLMVSVLSKAVHCESMPKGINIILSTVVMTPFFRTPYTRFLSCLDTKDTCQVTLESLPIFREILTRMPSEGWHIVNTIALLSHGLLQRNNVKDAAVIKCIDELNELLRISKPETPEMDVSAGMQGMEDDDELETPPESFRDLPIIPRKEELDGSVEIFLLRNKVGTRFKDLEHYLECQFRLFRADVIMPLKRNIQAFKKADEDALKDYRTYAGVHILRPVCSSNGLCYRLAFDHRPLQRVKWESSQRLIYGSLLCLSSDKFIDNVLFATVDSRDPAHLKHGLVDVRFLSDLTDTAYRSRAARFDMVESPAYFEAYKDVLICMKEMTGHNLPFQEYIVQCENTVKEPLYLQKQRNIMYDLRPLVDDKFKILDRSVSTPSEASLTESKSTRTVCIQDTSSWPLINCLDESQSKALHNALTREFALIQGPPGTGKTYLGINILKTLLHNSDVWLHGQPHRPILVVCYTNHALDQFLGGMLDVFDGRLIRVGGRFTTELMKKHSLKHARDGMKKQRAVPSQIHEAKMAILRKMKSLTRAIHINAAKLEVAKREIIHENCLRSFMDGRLKRQFPQEGKSPRGSIIIKWLGVETDLTQTDRSIDQSDRIEDVSDEGDSADEGGSLTDYDLPENRRRGEIVEDLLEVFDLDFDFDTEDTRDVYQPPETEEQVTHNYVALNVTQLGEGRVSRFNFREREKQRETLQKKRCLKHSLMKKITSFDTMTQEDETSITDIWKLQSKARWRLYRYWVDLLCAQAWEEIKLNQEEYEKIALRFQEILLQEDKLILTEAAIIGMTTTGAARYQKVLNEIGPKIIIVEEAAEVLEAHVIGTLSKRCEHLILIGDHKQLRPNPTVHELAKKYKLEISLFERMIKSGLHCDVLEWQHRMRPEIADIIRPIYPHLKDHDIVKTYENVKGVRKNVFFIEHQHQHNFDEETKSFENTHEAEYLACLCKYLLKQGYQREQITILSTYSAQIRRLRITLKKQQISGVNVVAVDSYQGEENDIVLLSLVRSGNKGSIGFLKEENRVCVALSRAKIGLYVIGNFTHIAEHSELWKKICIKANIDDNLGPALVLSCHRHPDEGSIQALDPEDFESAPEGGCTRQCDYRLPCGHVCTKVCHSNDPQHKEFPCSKPCKKPCKNGHTGCKEVCYKPCPPCEVPVLIKLEACGHTQNVPCHIDARRYQCQEPVSVTRPCGHSSSVACGQKDTEPCNDPCKAQLACGHLCQGTCGTCHNGRLHQPCTAKCMQILICGHECQSTCNDCPPCEKPCENRCSHSKCERKCGDPCVPCKEPCRVACRHGKCTSSCGDMCNKKECKDICRTILGCRHPCVGLCGAPCPRVCRVCDSEEISSALEVFGTENSEKTRFVQLEDCSHIFEVKSLDKYMKENSGDDDKTVVQLKKCPSCQTPIRRNQRYANFIKATLSDIEKAKLKVRGNVRRMQELKQSIVSMRNRFKGSDRVMVDQLTTTSRVPSEARLSAQISQLRILEKVIGLEKIAKTDAIKYSSSLYDLTLRAILDFKEWLVIPRSCFGQQERQDSQRELERLTLSRFLTTASQLTDSEGKEISTDIKMRLDDIIRRLASSEKHESVLPDARMLKEEVKGHVSESTIGVSDEERVMIVEAVGLNRGHWYKCKEGHVYAIGECGRAYEEATCPECGGAVGGDAHRLTEDNAWAPEMDDAEELPWSEESDYELAWKLHQELNG